MRLALCAAALAFFGWIAPALAMDGVNMDTGDTFTVDDSTTFKEGDTVSMFDGDGNEIDVVVNAVKDNGGTVDVDVINQDTGDTATVEFTKP